MAVTDTRGDLYRIKCKVPGAALKPVLGARPTERVDNTECGATLLHRADHKHTQNLTGINFGSFDKAECISATTVSKIVRRKIMHRFQ